MILEPNRRRRTRAFRAVAGVVVLLFVSGLVASGWTAGWTLPTLPIAGGSSAQPAAATATTAPIAVLPSVSPTAIPTAIPSPTPAPTPGPDGCIPPSPDLQPAGVISHGPRTSKVIALTFDDGYDKDNVERIVRFLVKNHVNATFFPTAQAVQQAPKTWKLVAQSGFPIANHTYHHFSLKGLCFEKQLAELHKAISVITDQAIPIQGFMRPPYEEFDLATRLAARAAGESYVVLWDVDTMDWTGLGRDAIARRALAGKSGSIILMHTSVHATAAALWRIVSTYRKRGYRFVTVGQMYGIPGPAPF